MTTLEAAHRIGISKSTLLRWIGLHWIDDVQRDLRGWRVWTEEDIGRVKRFKEDLDTPPPGDIMNPGTRLKMAIDLSGFHRRIH